jgi:hypothetical protein
MYKKIIELLSSCARESSMISKDWGVSAANLSFSLFLDAEKEEEKRKKKK